MSAIRPDLPAAPFPPHPEGQTPARASRSDFFKAALDAVRAAPSEPALTAAAPRPTPAMVETQPGRPGALLDIRV